MAFDVSFDHRLDSKGRDPDTHSPTLKAQHRVLWSKPLPDSRIFSLEEEEKKYLKYVSDSGVTHISSDTISHSLRDQKRLKTLIAEIPSEELDNFQSAGSVIGARIIFPGNRVNGHATINQARGMNSRINDRFDLTLECIRLFYSGGSSPLQRTFIRYSSFFELFADFKGYVDFFLLQDLISDNYEHIKFFLPHDNHFDISPRPKSVEEYNDYMLNTIEFVSARNERIQSWIDKNL